MKHLFLFITLIIGAGLIACSDNSTGSDDTEVTPGVGSLTVSGDLQAEHEGISQYIGLRSSEGGFINLAIHVTQFPIGSEEVNDFNFTIRMVGSEGPFTLETGEYVIGEAGNQSMLITYSNRTVSENTVTYGSTPNSSGTVTILSVSSTSIEAVYDVSLNQITDTGTISDENSINITGALNAECAAAGIGC
ncbi:MAG: hypothetical protein JJU37_06135 [Balneolaceae bacterium]|nr:hypothetical protein [Balneolaceae bacterium]